MTLLGGAVKVEAPISNEPGFVEMGTSVKELAHKLLSSSEMTRVSAALLWALLAFVKHRTEELLRMDSVLTSFMQAWQLQAGGNPSSALGVIPVGLLNVDKSRKRQVHWQADTVTQHLSQTSFRRAYEWMHLRKNRSSLPESSSKASS